MRCYLPCTAGKDEAVIAAIKRIKEEEWQPYERGQGNS
jgi:hypothetical protein